MGEFIKGALKAGFAKMVEASCKGASAKITDGSQLSYAEKQGVEGLLCESMTFVADIIGDGNASAARVGTHLIANGISMGKLTKQQQIYCSALKAEIALNSYKLAGVAAATYAASVAGGNGGLVGGGITGTVVAGPAGTVPGMVAGGLIGAGGPLLIGSIEMYDTIATITDLAIDMHSQCGPLSMDKAVPPRGPMPAAR